MTFPTTGIQTAVALALTKAQEGLLADINPIAVDTGIIEETNGIKFGRGVIQGTADDEVLLPSSSSDSVIGVTIATANFVADADGIVTMPNKASGSILKDGHIYVSPLDAVVPAEALFCVYKTPEQVSTITFDADLVTSNTIDMDVNAVALTQETFASDHATTMANIAAQLVTDFPLLIDTAVVDARTIEIIAIDGEEIAITDIVVAAGASQAGGTWAINRAYDATILPGVFRGDNGAVTGIANSAYAVAVTGGTFEETAAAGGLAKIRVK